MTLFFAKEHFKTAVPLAITSLLVMYTLKGSVSSKLPPTSYIKFIDIWLLYGLFIPFIISILLVLIEHAPSESSIVFVRSGGKEKKKKSPKYDWSSLCKLLGQAILPLIQILSMTVYAIIAIVKHNATPLQTEL